VHGTSTEDLLKQIVAAPMVRCDQVQWSLFGISLAGWNAILSLGGAAVIAFLSLKGSRR
jgi:disulfide bond formation protein DsbB